MIHKSMSLECEPASEPLRITPVPSTRSNEALNLAADRALALSSALWGVVVLRAVGTLAPSGIEEHVVDGQVNLLKSTS